METKKFWNILFAMVISIFGINAYGSVIPTPPPNATVVTQTFSNNTPLTINNSTPAISQIDVAMDGLSIFDVNLTTNIQHPRSGELKIYLIPPAGKVIVISTDNGSTSANVFSGTVWDDGAGITNGPGAVSDTTFANNVVETTLVPESAMATMLGFNPNGKWQLYVYDTAAGNDGQLNGWSLEITALRDTPKVESVEVSNTTPVAISDNATATSTIQFPNSVNIYDATLHLKLQHSYSGDLDITLTSPAGTVVTISTDNGNGFANVFADTIISDSGYYPITDIDLGVLAPPLQSAIPEEAMGAFTGQNAMGQWTLSISDDASSDTGILNGWSIEVASAVSQNSLFFDSFNDNVLGTNFKYAKGNWSESNGRLIGKPGTGKAVALAKVAACTNCSVHTLMRTVPSTKFNVTLMHWYKDSGNRVEVTMKSDGNVWTLKEYSGGKVVRKASYNELFSAGSFYDVRLEYNNTDNSVSLYVNNFLYGTLMLKANHKGVPGLKSVGSIAEFDAFSLQGN